MFRLGSRAVMGATLFVTPGTKGGIDLSGVAIVVFVVLVVVVGLLLGRHSKPGPPDPNDGDGWGKGPPRPEPLIPTAPEAGFRSTMRSRRAYACGARAGWRTCGRGGRDDRPASPTERRRGPRSS